MGFGYHSGVMHQNSKSIDAQENNPNSVDLSIKSGSGSEGGELVVIAIFILSALIFIPLGIATARYFNTLESLSAYLVNIIGSLVGTGVFMALSFKMLPPLCWFSIGLIGSWLLIPRIWKYQAPFIAVAAIILNILFFQSFAQNIIWSPYQRVSWYLKYAEFKDYPHLERSNVLYQAPVFVNYTYHQNMIDLGFTQDPKIEQKVLSDMDRLLNRSWDTPTGFYWRYTAPYRFIKPKNVLIIAAGNGNEAAAALREGAEHIDAVEIDPGIIEVGRRFHPEHPYDNPKVTVICDDAHSLINRITKKYDLIVMNALDSHSQFASSAGLRLDSYIYTIEFFEQIRNHLAPGGLFAMEFSGFLWNNISWSRERIEEILWRVFGYRTPKDLIAGAGGPLLLIRASEKPSPATYNKSIWVSTEDWPQFYLRQPMIPRAYLRLIIIVLLITFTGIFAGGHSNVKRIDLHFLFLGAAFMLFEIKNITVLSLVFGATWMVQSFVIVIILSAIMLANITVLKIKEVPYWISYGILFFALFAEVILPAGMLLHFGLAGRIAASFIKVAVPIFGAGLVFAASFRRAIDPSLALGWNLLGAILGGLGEYLSLITGIQILGLYIAVLYLLSLITLPCSHLKKSN